MDIIDFSSFLALLSFLLCLAMLFKVTTQSKHKFDPNSKLPPGPRKLPLIGNLHLFASSQAPHRVLADLASKYGPMMHVQLGEISTLIISSPEAAKEVMKTHDITFANRPSHFGASILFYNSSGILFAPYGTQWRQLRKTCTVELFSAKRVQSFRPTREEEFSNLCKWIASKEGSSINLSENISLTICDIVMRASLGFKNDELATFSATVKETNDLLAGFYLADLYPSFKFLRTITGLRRRVEKVHKQTDRIIGKIINAHKEANAKSKQQEDIADVLLKFHNEGNEIHITIENIKAVLLDVLNGGTETSSTKVDWAMAEMMRHPRVLKKAQDEVRQVFNAKGFVDESNFDELKYLKLVIKETLRMHPPATLLAPRVNSEHCEINGYEIPTNTRVFVNVWAIGRDSKYWKEADSFIPERFLDSLIDFKGNNFEFLPFGAGRRICPAMTFGLANVELPLAMFLYHFDWALPDGIKPENVDMTESLGLATGRKNPLCVIPVVKKPLLVK